MSVYLWNNIVGSQVSVSKETTPKKTVAAEAPKSPFIYLVSVVSGVDDRDYWLRVTDGTSTTREHSKWQWCHECSDEFEVPLLEHFKTVHGMNI